MHECKLDLERPTVCLFVVCEGPDWQVLLLLLHVY